MLPIIEFVSWCAVVTMAAAFLLSLAVKWGWLEWMQVHAPNDFIHKLLTCKFCTSFWVCVGISLFLCVATGHWVLMAAPICTTIITRDIW